MSDAVEIRLTRLHPLRARVLAILDEREATVKGIADELGERNATVSYHTKKLRETGLIDLVRTEPRRGALERYYRSRARNAPTLNLELALKKTAWNDVDDAIATFKADIADIAKRHPGTGTRPGVVLAVAILPARPRRRTTAP